MYSMRGARRFPPTSSLAFIRPPKPIQIPTYYCCCCYHYYSTTTIQPYHTHTIRTVLPFWSLLPLLPLLPPVDVEVVGSVVFQLGGTLHSDVTLPFSLVVVGPLTVHTEESIKSEAACHWSASRVACDLAAADSESGRTFRDCTCEIYISLSLLSRVGSEV